MRLRIVPDLEHPLYHTSASPISETVIRLEDVTVRYRVPHEPVSTLKEYAIRLATRKVTYRDYLALHRINLEICKGEVFAIIGKNGAGKSTLLKLVARVLQPTQGRVWVKGRVAPLLDISAGFHPELTGRENIFLNGTLLGLSRKEIAERLENIVNFAELGDFVDAPLRMYSSGMMARLGFAVATDVEPDILLIDEILAVGDEAFQRKCASRIERFREAGTTILIVSHDMSSVRRLCQRAACLDKGEIRSLGLVNEVVSQYGSS